MAGERVGGSAPAAGERVAAHAGAAAAGRHVSQDSSAHATPAVELAHVTFGYGAATVLDDVSVAFPRGQVSVLVGPNGCGKSTLVRCVAQGLRLRAGSIHVAGHDVAGLDSRARARLVAVMPQGAPAPDMEVGRLVRGGRYPYRGAFASDTDEDREAVRAAMDEAGCAAWAGRNVRDLSGGQRQRAYLALALAQQTDVVLLDEPTAYLDPGACFDLAGIVAGLRARGVSVVMVLHDLPLALACADCIAVMRAGRVEAFGAPDDVAASGVIDDVFGVRLRAVEADGERAWALLPA